MAEYTFEQWATEKIRQHHAEIYEGHGVREPSILARVGRGEDDMEQTKRDVADVKKMGWAIICLLIASLGGIITELIKK